MAPQPRSSDSNISYERAATLQDLKEMAMIDAVAQTPSPDIPRLARSLAQPAQKRGVGFGFESLEAEMQAYKLNMEDEIRNRNQNIDGGNKEAKEKFVVFKDEDEVCVRGRRMIIKKSIFRMTLLTSSSSRQHRTHPHPIDSLCRQYPHLSSTSLPRRLQRYTQPRFLFTPRFSLNWPSYPVSAQISSPAYRLSMSRNRICSKRTSTRPLSRAQAQQKHRATHRPALRPFHRHPTSHPSHAQNSLPAPRLQHAHAQPVNR